MQHLEREDAEEAMNTFLSLPSLVLIDTTQEIIEKAHTYVFEQNIDTRDSIHLASKNALDLNKLLTEDTDFEKYEGKNIGLDRLAL